MHRRPIKMGSQNTVVSKQPTKIKLINPQIQNPNSDTNMMVCQTWVSAYTQDIVIIHTNIFQFFSCSK
uniref:Uncharacterized protein n=1 Tax=Rhizophora mucronata TaxID=61149 RepID=A0A2P2R057_RHIMU